MNEIKQTLQQDADALLKRLQQSRKNGTGVTLGVSDVGVLCEEIDSLKAQLTEYTKAALDVLGERNRQIEQEHYSIEHDDSYQNNELPRAAASYVNNVVSRGWVFNSAYGPKAYQSEEVPDFWPWSDEHWKPKNPRRDLVKAAALIIAEIDRMDRSSAGEQS